jgi:hypothetical protein
MLVGAARLAGGDERRLATGRWREVGGDTPVQVVCGGQATVLLADLLVRMKSVS